MEIAKTILQQLGGAGRLQLMTGANTFVALKYGVTFKIKNRKVNFVKITLNGKDLYDVYFYKLTSANLKLISEHNDIYFDELIPLFEKETGMYLTLYAKGGRIKKDERTEMILSQLKQIHHHEKELQEIIKKDKTIEPWVIAKMARVTSDLSDVTHYEDGKVNVKMAKGGGVSYYSSIDDLKKRTEYATKTKSDKEFIDLIESIVEVVGIDKITDSQFRTQKSGRSIGFQFNNHLNVFYKSSWVGLSRDKYPAYISVQDETGEIIKADDIKPSYSKYEGGSISFEFNKKGKDSFKNWIIEKLKTSKMEKGGGVSSFEKNSIAELNQWKKEKLEDIDYYAKTLGVTDKNYSYIEALTKLNDLVEDCTKIIKSGILKNGEFTYWKTFNVKSYKGNIETEAYFTLEKEIAYSNPKFDMDFAEFNKKYPYSTKDSFSKEFIGRMTIPILGYKLCDYTTLGFSKANSVGGFRNNSFAKGGYLENEEVEHYKNRLLATGERTGYLDTNDLENPKIQRLAEDEAEEIVSYLEDAEEFGSSDFASFFRSFILNAKGIDIWKKTFSKGGSILNEYEEEEFIKWKEDGNVSKNADGSYSTQDAQFRNSLKNLRELKKYFKKEFFSDTYYEKGGGVDHSFDYMMLGRLQQDNEYFLNYGQRNEKHLWAGNVEDQIKEMKRIYKKLPVKPEWLSMEDILKYEKQMKNSKYKKGGMTKCYADGGEIEIETPRVYIEDYDSAYSGKSFGQWLDLSKFKTGQDVMDKISDIASDWSKRKGEKVETISVTDYENIPRSLAHEWMSSKDYDFLVKAYEVAKMKRIPLWVIGDVLSDYSDSFEHTKEGMIEFIDENYLGYANSDSDLAYDYIERNGGIKSLAEEMIKRNFDYDKYGRDTRLSMSAEEERKSRYNKLDDFDLGKTLVEQYSDIRELPENILKSNFNYRLFGDYLTSFYSNYGGYYFRN
jgi:antirestriction protein